MSFKARAEFTGPQASYVFAFPYLDPAHVKFYVDDVAASFSLQNANPDSGGEVVPVTAPGASASVVVVRETPSGPLVDFQGASLLTEEDLDTANRQALYVAEEATDIVILNEAVSASALVVANAVTDVVTNAQAASEAARDAAVVAQGAAEDAAVDAISNAAAQVAAATTQAENAAVSAGAALTSQNAAAASAAAASAIVSGSLTFQGLLDASGGTLPANVTSADYWIVSVGGTAGGFDLIQGDLLFYNALGYYLVPSTNPDALFRDGSLAMLGGLNMGGNAVTNVTTLDTSGPVTVGGTAVAQRGMPIVSELGTTRTLALADSGCYVRCDNASAITVTIPTNSTVAFPTGTEIVVCQSGAGTVTFNPTFGVTVNSVDSKVAIAGQHAAVTLKKVGTDQWDLFGALA